MARAALGRWLLPLALIASTAVEAQTGDRSAYEALVADARAAMQADPARALAQATQVQRVAVTLPSGRDVAVATALWLQGEAQFRLGAIDQAAPHITRALKLAHRSAPGTKLEGDILLSSGSIHGSRGQSSQALAAYQNAYAIYQRIGAGRDQAIALLCIAALYGDANDFASSLRYLDQALQVYRGDPSLLISIYNNRASTLNELGRFREAEDQYRRALALAKPTNSALLEARILGNIARVRLKSGKVAEAEMAVDEGLRLVARGEARSWRPQLLAIAAQAALQRGDLAQARALIDERFRGVDLSTTTLPSREAHQTAYDTYRALGINDLAVQHLAALKRLDDQATKLATSANTALAAARFDFTNQKLKIAALENEQLQRSIAFEQARIRTQRYVAFGVVGTTIVIIALLGFGIVTLRRSRDKVRAANDDLAVSNTALGKALAAKTEFLATTSHEIRTPLNGILGMTQVMLADPRLAADTRDRINVVHGAGVTMRALVDDILDVAKMETGNLTVEEAPFDLRATLIDATRLWDDQARAKGLRFTVDAERAPTMILGDAARVRQIAFNLLSNAVKFTGSGGIALTVAARGDRYEIVVADTGIGIATDKRDEVFESFRQADAGTTRQFGGTGLGLSICRNLARAMGGDVAVESVVGEGSTFTVSLPLVPAEQPEPCAQPDADGNPGVLILDRNPITRAMFRTLLAPRAGGLATAGSIADAMDCLNRGGITLLLVDDATVRDEADPAGRVLELASAARAHGGRMALLWTGELPDGIAGVPDQVIGKPVGGAKLIELLFTATGTNSAAASLVSQAA